MFKNLTIADWAQTIAAVATVGALIALYVQIKFEGLRYSLGLVQDFQRQYQSEEFRATRQAAAESILKARNNRESMRDRARKFNPEDNLLDFFNQIGYVVELGLIDIRLLENAFYVPITHYYSATEEYIDETYRHRPDIWKELRNLKRDMDGIATRRGIPRKYPSSVTDGFLAKEAALLRHNYTYKPHSALGRPIIIPRGVSEPQGRRGYLANDVAAGISALDLTTGELLWTTDAATQPVFVAESRLAALKRRTQRANVLLVVMLDVDDQGKVALVSEPIVFPDWVVVTTAPSEDFSFEVWGDANELKLEWEAHARYRGGAAPSLQIQQHATHDASGVARVNLKSGRVEMLPPEEQAVEQFPKRLEEVETASFKRGIKWYTSPWTAGEKVAALVFEDGEEPVLMLKTWRLPAAEEETPVAVGKGRRLMPEVTPDGQYLFVHREAISEEQRHETTRWQVFSVATGRLIASPTLEAGAQEACVVGSRVLYVVEESPTVTGATKTGVYRSILKAREMMSNKLLWERTLQERRASQPPKLRQ